MIVVPTNSSTPVVVSSGILNSALDFLSSNAIIVFGVIVVIMVYAFATVPAYVGVKRRRKQKSEKWY